MSTAAADPSTLASLFSAWQARHGDRPVKAAKLHADVLALLNPEVRPAQFVTRALGALDGARSDGFVLELRRAVGKWGTISYRLRREAESGELGEVVGTSCLATDIPGASDDRSVLEREAAVEAPPVSPFGEAEAERGVPVAGRASAGGAGGETDPENSDGTAPAPADPPVSPSIPVFPPLAPDTEAAPAFLPPEPSPPPAAAPAPPVPLLPTLPPQPPAPRGCAAIRPPDDEPQSGDYCVVCHYGWWTAEALPRRSAWRCVVCLGHTQAPNWMGRQTREGKL